MHSYVIETDRLLLRPLTTADAEAEFVWLSDPEVNRFMPYNLYTSVEQAVAWLRSVEECEDEYHFGFVRKADGLLIGAGSIGPRMTAPTPWRMHGNSAITCAATAGIRVMPRKPPAP